MSEGIFIGLMSGTSLDGIDAVAVRFAPAFELLGTHSEPLPPTLRAEILALCQPGDNEIERLAALDPALGRLFATAANQLLQRSGLKADQVSAIGSHGQTVRHRPGRHYSLQIGDPNLIAELTGITTIADFRRRDMAAGGQGAPLVPAFHAALFRCSRQDRVLLNIGGMANLTWLPADHNIAVRGFDTGPGNVLLDGWIAHHRGLAYDAGGDWARSGQVIPELLQRMLALPFFQAPPPKSTGREQFNLAWLQQQLAQLGRHCDAADVQATLLELTARSAADAIRQQAAAEQLGVYLCGGGSHNGALRQRLAALLQPASVETTCALGLDPDWVEAVAFAWLACRTRAQQCGNLPAVTGASGPRILGGIYQK